MQAALPSCGWPLHLPPGGRSAGCLEAHWVYECECTAPGRGGPPPINPRISAPASPYPQDLHCGAGLGLLST